LIGRIDKLKNFEESGCSKLKVNQIFSAGLMRLDQSKKIYDLQTDFSYVKQNIKKILDLSLHNTQNSLQRIKYKSKITFVI
jgi:hypothetical protein